MSRGEVWLSLAVAVAGLIVALGMFYWGHCGGGAAFYVVGAIAALVAGAALGRAADLQIGGPR